MKPYSGPLSVDLNITDRCNLRCIHCNLSSGEAFSDELPTERFLSILEQANTLGTTVITITGGEPLMNPDWYKIVKHMCDLGDWATIINTNGILWSDEDIRKVAEECPSLHIAISVDGANAKDYSILRKNPAGENAEIEFSRMLHNVKKMKSAGIQKIGFNVVITNKTLDNFDTVVDLAKKIDVSSVLAIKFFEHGRGQNYDLELSYLQWRSFIKTVVEKKKYDGYENVSISVTCPWELFLPMKELGYSYEETSRIWRYESPLLLYGYRSKRNLGCTAGVTNCSISADGFVYPCGTVTGTLPELRMGNLSLTSLEDIWANSTEWSVIRTLTLDNLGEPCINCTEKEICGGGCIFRSFVQTGTCFLPDPLCPNVKRWKSGGNHK